MENNDSIDSGDNVLVAEEKSTVTNNQKRKIKVGLARVLGLSDAIFIGIASLIGGGIFTTTGLALGYAGPSLLLVIVLNGIIALITGMVYAELGSTFPGAGGGFAWVKKGLGDWAGYISGWVSWFAQAVACALYALSFSFYLGSALFLTILPIFGINFHFLEGSLIQKIFSMVMIVLVGYVNYKGVSGTSRFGKLFVYFEVFILLIFGIFGLISFFNKPDFAGGFLPFSPNGAFGLLAAMGLMYIGFEGSEIIVQSGEEIKNPNKNIPKAIFISLGFVVSLYFLTVFGIIGGTINGGGWEVMAEAGQGALIKAAGVFMPGFGWIITIGGIFAALAALNSTIFSSSHVSFAMGRTGFLPKFLAKIHHKNRTPYVAIIISSVFILAIVAFLPLRDVAAMVDLLFIFLFSQLHIAMIALRKKLPDKERPFKMPLYPLLSIIALVAYVFLAIQLFQVSPIGIFIVFFWIIAGIIIYYIYTQPTRIERVEKQIILEEKIRVAPKKNYRILLPISQDTNWRDLLSLALIMAKEKNAELSILHIKQIPLSLPLEISDNDLENERLFIDEVSGFCRGCQVNFDVVTIIARSISRTIIEVTKKEDPDLLIVGWKGWVKTTGKIFGSDLDMVLRETKCDLIVARINSMDDFKNILLPTNGGPHTKFSGKVALALAKNLGSRINVAYVASQKEVKKEGAKGLKEILKEIVSLLTINDWHHLKSEILSVESLSPQSIACQIVQRSQDFTSIVMASASGRIFKEMIFGSTAETVARNSTCSIILTKYHRDVIEPLVSYLKSRF